MISTTTNLVRVGNVVEFADVENNLGAQPLSDEMLSSGYISLDGSELSIENLQISSGTLTYGTALGDTYGSYFLDFEAGFTGEITLTYDIVNSTGESITVERTLNVVDNVSDTSGSFAPFGTREDGTTIDQFWRDSSDPDLKLTNRNSSTYVREFTLTDGDNVDQWDPQLVQQGGSALIYRQQFGTGLIVTDSPDVENTLTNNQIRNLSAQNGTFSNTDLLTLNGATTVYTPDPGFAGYDTITFDIVNLDGESVQITKTIEVVPTDYSALTIEAPEPPVVTEPTLALEAGTEGVDFWYDGVISPNYDQDAFWYRGAAPLEEGGESKYWFKFKNTETTDELTDGGEYALIATKRDALDNGASIDSITGEYAVSKSFVSPDGIRMYAGIDEAAIQELSNFGAEDIEVYRWDVEAGQIVGTDGREILGGRLDNRFDTIGDEYAGSLSELNNNAYLDTLA